MFQYSGSVFISKKNGSCRLVVLIDFLTRQVKKCVEDVEAVCVSTLNKFVGVHLSDVRSVQSTDTNIQRSYQVMKNVKPGNVSYIIHKNYYFH